MRTLYDGQSFDIIRENEVFGGGDFTTNYSSGIEYSTGEATGGRYRYIEDGATGGRYRNVDGYIVEKTRFTGTKATLYANGESVGVNRFSSAGDSSGRAYFGTDILGSVRSATTDGAAIEDRYEYDAFGTPYKGDFATGLDGGYTGKPYDQTTGLYNYGYRDYSPETARFTTVDPIRDGSNWFSYVVNDPVNYVDLWGLEAIDWKKEVEGIVDSVTIGVQTEIGISGAFGSVSVEVDVVSVNYEDGEVTYESGVSGEVTLGNDKLPIGGVSGEHKKKSPISPFDLFDAGNEYEGSSEVEFNSDFTITLPIVIGSVKLNLTEAWDLLKKVVETALTTVLSDDQENSKNLN